MAALGVPGCRTRFGSLSSFVGLVGNVSMFQVTCLGIDEVQIYAANSCAITGFIRRYLIRVPVYRCNSVLEASRIVFVGSSTSVVHHVRADPRRHIGMRCATRSGPYLLLSSFERSTKTKNSRWYAYYRVDHWAKCNFPMLLF